MKPESLGKLQQCNKAHIKAIEMNANEKSKHIKLLFFFFKDTISKSPPGAAADKAGSQKCFSAQDEQEVHQATVFAQGVSYSEVKHCI